jgi:hypothetical protein
MSSINELNPNVGKTVKVFDSFYEFSINVPAAEYDVVYSFFAKQMKNKTAAESFALSLFRVSQETQINALTLLSQFEGNANGMALDVQMAYYLNLVRNRATLLGVGTAVRPNFYPARAVLQ